MTIFGIPMKTMLFAAAEFIIFMAALIGLVELIPLGIAVFFPHLAHRG